MTNLIGNIAGDINKAVGRAKQRADDHSLHDEGIAQQRKGEEQQKRPPPPAP